MILASSSGTPEIATEEASPIRADGQAVLTAANHSCTIPSSARMPDFAVIKAEDERRIDERDGRKPFILFISRL